MLWCEASVDNAKQLWTGGNFRRFRESFFSFVMLPASYIIHLIEIVMLPGVSYIIHLIKKNKSKFFASESRSLNRNADLQEFLVGINFLRSHTVK